MRQVLLTLVAAAATITLLVSPGSSQHAESAAGAPASFTGKVVETMNSGGYTYVQVDDGATKRWAAAPQFAVAVGDRVALPEGMPMRDFPSKTLGRTFETIYFVPAIQVVGGAPAAAPVADAHGAAGRNVAPPLEVSGIQKPEGGYTVAELFANKAALVGKDVAVRGKVAKVSAGIMGRNWVHVQDGTGSPGTNDLTVTTSASAATGDTVLVRGKLGTDKDFGFGYRYDVIIENASVTVE